MSVRPPPTRSVKVWSADFNQHSLTIICKRSGGSILSRPKQSVGRIEGCGFASNRYLIASFDTCACTVTVGNAGVRAPLCFALLRLRPDGHRESRKDAT
jgi:hypothetical protein